MRPADGEVGDGLAVDPSTVVQELIPMVAAGDRPILVVDRGTVVGVVDRAAVMAALIEAR
jgi:hypothetical protein